jgi:hypothetical protein
MDLRRLLLTLAIVSIIALAGCSGAGNPAAPTSTPTPQEVDVTTTDADLNAFYVIVEGDRYLCIEHEESKMAVEGYEGYYGLSCTPLGNVST